MIHIREVAQTVGIEEEDLEFYGKYKAKLSDELIHRVENNEDGKLVLNFTPKLSNWLFDEGKVTFRLLSSCDITYVNETGKNTFGDDAAVVDRVEINGETVSTKNKIVGEMAEAVRDGKINNITVYFK